MKTNKLGDKKKVCFCLYAFQLFTQKLLDAVGVPLEDAELLSNVPVIVQELENRIGASHILRRGSSRTSEANLPSETRIIV